MMSKPEKRILILDARRTLSHRWEIIIQGKHKTCEGEFGNGPFTFHYACYSCVRYPCSLWTERPELSDYKLVRLKDKEDKDDRPS